VARSRNCRRTSFRSDPAVPTNRGAFKERAAARRVDIVLEVVGDQIVLLIADDGRGLDPAVHRPGHFGLESMRERAAAAGGTLELVSSKDAGTQNPRPHAPRIEPKSTEHSRSLG